jgi:hypothetical protein
MDGIAGAQRALNAMLSLANDPSNVTVKFDGSPSLIFGWDADGFVLTDKSGFNSKKYDGMPRSTEAVNAMLAGDTGRRLTDTTPEGLKKRQVYASGIAALYELLKSIVPKTTVGYIQGDLLWQGTPPIVDGKYVFGPVKIHYKVPTNSDLGKNIAVSKAGIVIHSIFKSRADMEPRTINDITKLNLIHNPQIVVVPHKMKATEQLTLPTDIVASVKNLIEKHGAEITSFLNDSVKSLPALLKSFAAYKASTGNSNYDNAGEEFVTWLGTDSASIKMQSSIRVHISSNSTGYAALWKLIQTLTQLKLNLKSQLDNRTQSVVAAEYGHNAHKTLHGKRGHEGFVADTQYGKIKLVNRHEYMHKPQAEIAENASAGGTSAGGIASVANPVGPTISRTPNLFGYVPVKRKKTKKKPSVK